MIALPVHCCCNPKVRLGWLQVDERHAYAGARVKIVIPRSVPLPMADAGMFLWQQEEELDIELLWNPEGPGPLEFLAVKSGHRTNEQLARLPGFTFKHPSDC